LLLQWWSFFSYSETVPIFLFLCNISHWMNSKSLMRYCKGIRWKQEPGSENGQVQQNTASLSTFTHWTAIYYMITLVNLLAGLIYLWSILLLVAGVCLSVCPSIPIQSSLNCFWLVCHVTYLHLIYLSKDHQKVRESKKLPITMYVVKQ
jgi:hypothetical protein